MLNLQPAAKPTMYFIGVTTTRSSIMKVFPKWSEELQLGADLVGIDLPLNAKPEDYLKVVHFIKNDPLSLGALVTTHKMNILKATKSLFNYLDPYATMFEEISSISKLNGELLGHAKDPISSGLAMEAFIPLNHWVAHDSEVLILGSGGSALAISAYLSDKRHGKNVPQKITITNHNSERLEEAKYILSRLDTHVEFVYELCKNPEKSDELLESLKPYSLIVNATGMGKDRPGSPISDAAQFPQHSLVWELNYRGELNFLHQARRQQKSANLRVEDGWVYFIHGWSQVVAEVFHISLDSEKLSKLDGLATVVRS